MYNKIPEDAFRSNRGKNTKKAVKKGLFGAVIGGIIGGPAGATLGGAIGYSAGYADSKDTRIFHENKAAVAKEKESE